MSKSKFFILIFLGISFGLLQLHLFFLYASKPSMLSSTSQNNARNVPQAEQDSSLNTNYEIINPYQHINFSTYNQYKANLHAHTTLSDGSDTPLEQIEKHIKYKYDILAIADHDGQRTAPAFPWSQFTNETPIDFQGETCELYEISGRKILAVMGCELAQGGFLEDHHRVSLMNRTWKNIDEYKQFALMKNYEDRFKHADSIIYERNGLWLFAHPSLHFDHCSFDWYLNFVKDAKSLVGIEVFTYYKYNAKKLWDYLLKNLMPMNAVWGHAATDDHGSKWGPDNRIGVCSDLILMEDMSPSSLYRALKNGEFFFVFDTQGNNLERQTQNLIPIIHDIHVDEHLGTITIDASHYTDIRWIYDGITISTGKTFYIRSFNFNYIRAELIGADGATLHTQPFGIINLINDIDSTFAKNKIKLIPMQHGYWIQGLEGNGMLELMDFQGKVYYSKQVTNNEFIIMDKFKRGCYIVRIKLVKDNYISKIVIL